MVSILSRVIELIHWCDSERHSAQALALSFGYDTVTKALKDVFIIQKYPHL